MLVLNALGEVTTGWFLQPCPCEEDSGEKLEKEFRRPIARRGPLPFILARVFFTWNSVRLRRRHLGRSLPTILKMMKSRAAKELGIVFPRAIELLYLLFSKS